VSTDKDTCKDCLRTYYGMGEYQNHPSRFSAQYMHYINVKFGTDLVQECKKEIKNGRG
jgi:hypothetical protein